MSRTLMSGNEAAARGAWEAGVSVGAGYPGTPSTEVLKTLAQHEGVVFIDAEALAFAEATWHEVLVSRVPPKTVEENLRAFQLGRDACAEGVCDL